MLMKVAFGYSKDKILIKCTVYPMLSLVPHPCIRQPCLNGGTCVDPFNSKEENEDQPVYDVALPWSHLHFHCHCPPGFIGSRCESKSTEIEDVIAAKQANLQ